ncbi:Pr6Pr family membrane protein [Salinibacterium sp.]|uniref:Pr6Pr family membrane protein n=1 Tax=Salinibacterium sp. TaxID=1915057 RepID=UPI00286B812A|nr:Pr6Pr family membrane protein [Salinibacterium sp.]
MKLLFAVLRTVAGVAGLAAVISTFADTASRVAINPFNFFGYFTLQSNILTAVVLLTAAAMTFQGRKQSRGLILARGCVTTYIVIVGAVYNTLLVGTPGGGGVELPWANFVLHIAVPLYVAVDWVFFGDRTRLPWNKFWIVLVYPIVWLVVVLARGATDGWVPYPFLNPALGYGVVAMYGVGIAGAIGLVGAGVWALSRVRILKP